MKQLPLDPINKALERIAIAITPTKYEIFRKLCRYYKRNMSELSNGLIDEFLAQDLFEIGIKNLDKLRLTEEGEDYAKKIIEFETCPVCNKRQADFGDTCEYCRLQKTKELLLNGRERLIPYLEKMIADPEEEDKENFKRTIKEIKEKKHIYGDEEDLRDIDRRISQIEKEEGNNKKE